MTQLCCRHIRQARAPDRSILRDHLDKDRLTNTCPRKDNFLADNTARHMFHRRAYRCQAVSSEPSQGLRPNARAGWRTFGCTKVGWRSGVVQDEGSP